MKNELQKHKTADTVKWIAVFIAIIVLTAGMLAALTNGFTDFNQYGWLDEKEESKQEPADVTDGDGDKLVSGKVYDMPTAMIFRNATSLSMSASGGITVTATVKPDSAVNKNVDWTVSWQNPESEFATGKTATDYVTAQPSSDGSTTAVISCLAPFGEQIKVSVISRANPGAYAVMTVDYEKKVSGVSAIATNEDYTFSGTTLKLDDSSGWSNSDKNYSDYWDLTYTYSEGTLDPASVTKVEYYVKSSDELSQTVSSAKTEYVQMTDNRSDMLEKALGIALFTEKVDKTKDPVYQVGEGGIKIPVWPKITTFNSATWNNVVSALNGLTGYAFDLKIVTTNSKGETEETVLQISVDKSTIGAQANSIELDNESLIF